MKRLRVRWLLCCVPAWAAAQEAPAPEPAVVTVLGLGQTRQVQNLARADLQQALPGTSALKTLEKLPGVSFQSADALGSYEWSTRISIRGFSQGQLGFTLDGIPLGNMSYGNNNGLHISRAISSENLFRVDLSQGSGSVGTASTSNLGGTVQFIGADPAGHAGAGAAVTAGSDNMLRTFARIDTGALPGGGRAYASAMRQRADKWKGLGPQDHDQVNLRYVQDFGPHRLTAFWNWSDRRETDYQDLSLEMQRRLGWNWDNYAPDWQRALDAAHGVFRGGVTNLDDAYYAASGLRKDLLYAATLALAFGDSAANLSAYHHGSAGQGHWHTPYQASSPGMPISIRTSEYGIDRSGVLGSISRDGDTHAPAAGFWLEHNHHLLTRNYYAAQGPDLATYFLQDPFLTGFQQDFHVRVAQFWLRDSLRLLDGKLKVEGGAKWTRTAIDAASINAARAAGRLVAAKPFLPQLGASYELGPDEVFASAARNLRAFDPGIYGQFSQSQAAFDANAASLKPESSVSLDLGYRFRRGPVSGSVAVYRAQFDNRLVNVANCAGVVGCPNTVINVGKVDTHGAEAAAIWALTRQWSWFNGLTFNDSRYRSDYVDNGALVRVAGKQVVDAPRAMWSSELAYDDGTVFARLGGKYTGKRYYTYTNDNGVAAYTLVNLSAGWRLGSRFGLHEVQLRANVNNLLDRRYFATVGSNQFVATDPAGTFATLLVGAPRQFALSLSASY
ncbi:MAG: TonB-dependent receptor [Telluria sp.]